ncbi:MAG: hypothetical protein A3F17_06675 [Gammaproteobacteria bacterium RIFCSPHIGHO2_12_FULL_41_15]|nr:MAG: hypothetical protein A3F17_06675 [Gammaproteobacteria bacterium RIFCSPHIGHO2_12_FULL_41_15]
MFKKLLVLLVVIFSTSVSFSATETLPKKLIALSSSVGNKFFIRSYSSNYFWPLALQFVTQENLAYCSIASSVMVLNALNIPAPAFSTHGPFKMFTQDNFFTPAVEKILPATLIKKQGSTLDQINQALVTFPVSIITIHADKITVNQFRVLAKKIITTNNSYIIINFLRTKLGEQGMGHMSPLVAYDSRSDRFLMLDVARYRYPPVWIKTQNLWNAMHTIDEDAHAYRGFLVVSKK